MPHDEPARPDPPREWAGLGLDYGTVRLTEARPEWGRLAKDLADRIRAVLGESAPGVEHVGSTAVPGLAAKPILDLAAGVNRVSIEAVRDLLEGLGYEYRGDARDRGGLVFVLEDRPRHRVAHVVLWNMEDRSGSGTWPFATFSGATRLLARPTNR